MRADGRLAGVLSPTAAVAVASIYWGTSWWPMRILKERGLDSEWAIFLMLGIVSLALSPAAWAARKAWTRHWRSFLVAGIMGGASLACYYLSVNLTTVARATLLFYLSPVWTTLIEFVALRRPIKPGRMLEIALGFGGLLVTLAPGGNAFAGANIGDGLALLAGVTFAVATFLMYRSPEAGGAAFTWACALGAAMVTSVAGMIFNPDGLARAAAASGGAVALLGPAALFAILIFLPMNLLTYWGASRLSPTRVSVILMCDVIVGIMSSALLTDDHIGPHELVGCGLILGAILVEPIRLRLRSAHPQADAAN
ncbi:DMT family transporter [Hansschlegelia quercus]|uniref:DMT family transporter n=1 Tax=Hansschlegelia quercus TaxID=2528245 RepID=A0A4Q9GH46_9HYPH|nr:DMT family transporter [Hansschlegelia quercus]TBN53479.1 DMT family transporter [Hansschlegelia quercus]